MATRFAFWRKIEEDSLAEKHAQPGLLSDFILGSQDGLVNVLGVILGVAVASRDITIILGRARRDLRGIDLHGGGRVHIDLGEAGPLSGGGRAGEGGDADLARPGT